MMIKLILLRDKRSHELASTTIILTFHVAFAVPGIITRFSISNGSWFKEGTTAHSQSRNNHVFHGWIKYDYKVRLSKAFKCCPLKNREMGFSFESSNYNAKNSNSVSFCSRVLHSKFALFASHKKYAKNTQKMPFNQPKLCFNRFLKSWKK